MKEDEFNFGLRKVEIEVKHSNNSIYSINTLELIPRYQNYESLTMRDNFIEAYKKSEILLITNFSYRIR